MHEGKGAATLLRMAAQVLHLLKQPHSHPLIIQSPTPTHLWHNEQRPSCVRCSAFGKGEGSKSVEMFEGFELNVKDPGALFGGGKKTKGEKSFPAKPKSNAPAKTSGKQQNSETRHASGVVIVRVTRAGRGGKTVTVASGLPPDPLQLQSLLKQLKTHLGTGGAIREGAIEVQGDHAAKLVPFLVEMGFKAKKG